MWDIFINLLTQVLEGIEQFCGDWGLAVIILTLIIRVILIPLMTKSTESSARMQALQPQMQAIKDKYSDDPARMNEEMQKFYSEHKFNVLGGCLPMVLQMPVFFGLFTVASKIPQDASFFSLLPTISLSPADVFKQQGIQTAAVYIFLVVLFAVTTFIPMVMNLKNTSEQQRSQTITMGVVMSCFMLWFGWTVPTAVLLYYNTSSLWQIVQQKLVTDRVMKRVKEETEQQLAREGVHVDVVRKEKVARPHKKDK